MKVSYRVFALAMLLVMFIAIPAVLVAGEKKDGVGFNADFRWRAELDGKDFDSDTDPGNFSYLRTRLGIGLRQGDVSGLVQFQYPLQLGWNSFSLDPDSVSDFHQAYLKVNNLLMDGISLKIGRMEMNYGDERLIGGVGWSNIGRTFEGTVLRFENDLLWADGFYTNQVERYEADNNVKDDDFVGLWGEYKPLKLNLFLLSNIKAAKDTINDKWETNLQQNTIGMHYLNTYDMGLGVLLDAAFQMGTNTNVNTDADSSIAAWLAVFSMWYNIDHALKPSVGAGVDITSGDDPTTTDNESFSNLFYTGHKWRGYMDYLVKDDFLFNSADTTKLSPGLIDMFIKVKLMPIEKLKTTVYFHNFTTQQEYTKINGGKSSALGNEIDFILAYPVKDELTASFGLGYFIPSSDWTDVAGIKDDGGLWAFLQLQKKFDFMK